MLNYGAKVVFCRQIRNAEKLFVLGLLKSFHFNRVADARGGNGRRQNESCIVARMPDFCMSSLPRYVRRHT